MGKEQECPPGISRQLSMVDNTEEWLINLALVDQLEKFFSGIFFCLQYMIVRGEHFFHVFRLKIHFFAPIVLLLGLQECFLVLVLILISRLQEFFT